MIGELHCHSNTSGSVEHFFCPSPLKVLKKARELGLDFLAITDHDTMAGFHSIEGEVKKYGVVLIPALEISTCPGGFFNYHPHVLAYGINSPIRSRQPVRETLKIIHQQKALAALAHPCCSLLRGRVSFKEDVKNYDFDFIEIFNAGARKEENKKAEILAKKANIPPLVGSDSHTLKWLGQALIEIKIPKTERWQDLVLALKGGKYRIFQTISPPWSLARKIGYPLACYL
jgi:predicted metal-dependent phosphoesterase TrpH